MAIERLLQGEGAFRKALSWVCAVTLALSMAVPNASAFAAASDGDTGDEATGVSLAQGGEDQGAPDASLSEAAEGGEQQSAEGDGGFSADADDVEAGTGALSAESGQPSGLDASGIVYGTMEAGEAWDGVTVDVSWYNTTDTLFTISTAAQLAGLAAITSPANDYDAWQAGSRESRAAGITQDNFTGKTVVLGADIDMGGKRMDPISDFNNWGGGGQGSHNGTYDEVAWQGGFEGCWYTIKNINIDGSVNCANNFWGYQGLFSTIGKGGYVRTLGVTGVVKGRVAGGIVGCSNTDMGSETSATLTMDVRDWPIIEDCWTNVEVVGNGSGSRGCGGIFGGESEYRAACNIINCYARGTVTNKLAGGIAGSLNGAIAGCYNTGVVSGAYNASIVAQLFMPSASTAEYKAIGQYDSNLALVNTADNVWREKADFNANPAGVTEGFVSSADLKAGAGLLGEAYAADTESVNNGYPVLYWQVGEPSWTFEDRGVTVDDIEPQEYTGEPVEPVVTVRAGDKVLRNGIDYCVSYQDNVDSGDGAYVMVYGLGRYIGFDSKYFTIKGPYLSVYEKVNDGEAQLVKTYTKAELEELSEDGSVSALFNKKGWRVSTATNYVALKGLFRSAGLSDAYASGAEVTFASGDFAVTQTYDALEGGKFYPATTATDADSSLAGDAVPAVLALKEATSAIAEGETAAQAAAANEAAANDANAPRILSGADEESYLANSTPGKRLVSNVDTITISYDEPVALKVQVLYANSDTPKVIKEYTKSDLWALQSDGDPVSGMFWKGGDWYVASSGEYVTLADLFANAGVGDLWNSNASLMYGGDDPSAPQKAAQEISYDTLMERCWFFPAANGANSDSPETKVAASPVLTLSEFSCKTGTADIATAADAQAYNLAKADVKNFPRVLWGISEDMYTTDRDSARGMYYWSNNAYLTIKTTEVDPDSDEPFVERIAGESAADTAAAIAAAAWDGETSEWAVLVRDDDFADAMSATGLAGALGAPIVLTDRHGLSDAARGTLESLGARNVYIIGGTGAMPGDFEGELAEAGATGTVERVFGNAAWDTSAACAEKIAELGGSPYAVVALSANFQDALSMSSFAYKYHAPILLTDDGDYYARSLPADAQSLLTGGGAFAGAQVIVAGGPNAVPERAMGFLGRGYERIWGDSGYDTSAAIAEYMCGNGLLDPGVAVVASGAQDAKGLDALAGAALAGICGAPILLANGQGRMEAEDYTTVDGFLASNSGSVRACIVLGGTYVMPDDTAMARIYQAMGLSQQ